MIPEISLVTIGTSRGVRIGDQWEIPNGHYLVSALWAGRQFRGPVGGEVVLVGHGRQAGEHVSQVSPWIETEALAAHDDGVDDGGALAGSR